MTVLLIGPDEIEALTALRALASAHPVDVRVLLKALKRPGAKAVHMDQMTRQTIEIPTNFMLTYSVEIGHPAGACRHMSMSVSNALRFPTPTAVWLLAEALGFYGSLHDCTIWREDLAGHGIAINVVQPIMSTQGSEAKQ